MIGWLLSFGEEAKLLKPDWLVKEVANRVKLVKSFYRKIK